MWVNALNWKWKCDFSRYTTEIKQKLKINNFFKCSRLWKWDERKQKYEIHSTYSHAQY